MKQPQKSFQGFLGLFLLWVLDINRNETLKIAREFDSQQYDILGDALY